jgi:hypothetical protein
MIAVWEAIAARDAARSSEAEIMNSSACVRTAATELVSSPTLFDLKKAMGGVLRLGRRLPDSRSLLYRRAQEDR